MPKKLPVLYSHKLFTPTFWYFYTDISVISVTLCNSGKGWAWNYRRLLKQIFHLSKEIFENLKKGKSGQVWGGGSNKWICSSVNERQEKYKSQENLINNADIFLNCLKTIFNAGSWSFLRRMLLREEKTAGSTKELIASFGPSRLCSGSHHRPFLFLFLKAKPLSIPGGGRCGCLVDKFGYFLFGSCHHCPFQIIILINWTSNLF